MRIDLRRHRAIIAFSTIVVLVGIGFAILLQPASIVPTTVTAPKTIPAVSSNAPTKTLPSTDPILDLFQPSEATLQQQLSTTQLSQSIENAMVVSYTLVRCDMLSQAEYGDTFHALVLYATRSHFAIDAVQAEAKVRAIADAASASYSLVYSKANCADPSLAQKASALRQWRESIIKSPAPAP